MNNIIPNTEMDTKSNFSQEQSFEHSKRHKYYIQYMLLPYYEAINIKAKKKKKTTRICIDHSS